MSTLDNIGAFLGGANQGVGQGMDIYAKYKQLQDEGEVRSKKKAIDQEVQKLTQSGVFENDPIGGMGQVADIYARHGLMDDWAKYNQTAVGLKKAKADQVGWQVFQAAGVDPVAAVPLMSKFAEAMGTGDKFELQPNVGGGYTLNSTVGGKTNSANYTDAQELEHAINSYVEPYLTGDIGKWQTNQASIAKDAAQTAQVNQASASAAALLPGQIGMQQANIGQSNAAASASRANAASDAALTPVRVEQAQAAIEASKANTAQSQAQIDEALALRPSKIAGSEADTVYKQGLASQLGKPQPMSIPQAIDTLVPKPVPDVDGNLPPGSDTQRTDLNTLATLISQGQGGGMDGTTAVAAATMLKSKLGKYNVNQLKFDRETGVIGFPDGTSAKVDPSGLADTLQYTKQGP